MGTAERIIEMMKYLCRVRHSTMPELAESFGVSVRTVKRDIDELGYLIPLETKTGRYDGGVYVMDNYRWDKQYMSAEETEFLKNIKRKATEGTVIILNEKEFRILDMIIEAYSVPQRK